MTMASRRDFLKAFSISALSLPAFDQWDFQRTKVAEMEFPRPDVPGFWKKIRRFFPIPEDEAFFNTGTLGASPSVVVEAAAEHLRKVATAICDWDYRNDDWISGYQAFRDIREKIAGLIHARTDEVALTENATMAMNFVANGLDLRAGDEVLTTDQEHSGGKSGWQLKQKRWGTAYREVVLPKPVRTPDEVVSLFQEAITPRTKVITLSHILSPNGTILPVKEICAEGSKRDIFTVIDGAQAIGQIGLDVLDMNCDAYYGSLHKWLLGPPGTGFLYIKSERAKDIWTTLAGGQWDNHEDEGFRFTQRGTGSLSLLMGLNAALDFHQAIGPGRVYARIKSLGDYLREGLKTIKGMEIYTSLHPAMCAGITSYNIAGLEPGTLMDELWTRKRIRIRGVRQCTHIYNSPEEIDATLEVVRDMAGSAGL
jgi:isopenicillin-N epimerase